MINNHLSKSHQKANRYKREINACSYSHEKAHAFSHEPLPYQQCLPW